MKNIRTLLREGYSTEELRRICYDVSSFRPVHNQLALNSGKDEIIDRLVEFTDQTLQFDSLLDLAKEHNPARYEKHQPYYTVIDNAEPKPAFPVYKILTPAPPSLAIPTNVQPKTDSVIEHDNVIYFLQDVKNRVNKTVETIRGIIGEDSVIMVMQEPVPVISSAEPNALYTALLDLSESLANSYTQVRQDLQDNKRSSWAGTAHEIREILANLLRLLAPDDEVKVQPWYKQEPNTSGSTQKQRVRYILQQQEAGSKEQEVVEQVVRLDDMLGDAIRATYSRASDAAHRFKTRKEVVRVFKYFEVFAGDLLNLD